MIFPELGLAFDASIIYESENGLVHGLMNETRIIRVLFSLSDVIMVLSCAPYFVSLLNPNAVYGLGCTILLCTC